MKLVCVCGWQAAQRALKNRALSYLSALKDPAVTQDLLARTRAATNMTDQISALACLADSESAAPGTLNPKLLNVISTRAPYTCQLSFLGTRLALLEILNCTFEGSLDAVLSYASAFKICGLSQALSGKRRWQSSTSSGRTMAWSCSNGSASRYHAQPFCS